MIKILIGADICKYSYTLVVDGYDGHGERMHCDLEKYDGQPDMVIGGVIALNDAIKLRDYLTDMIKEIDNADSSR